MRGQRFKRLSLPDLTKCVALIALATISGVVVWSSHCCGWLEFVAALSAGAFCGGMAGALVGVRLLPSLFTMAAFGGLTEGVVQGWQRFGYAGAALGGFAGIVVVPAVALLPVMFAHFIMVLRGIDPNVESVAPPDIPIQPKSGV